MKKISLNIKGMHCKSCETLIQDALLEAEVKECKVDSQKGTALVEFDEQKLSLPKIKAIIVKEGYKVE